MSPTPVTYEQALEQISSGRLRTEGQYCEVPTVAFVAKIDVNMPALPSVAMYRKQEGGAFECLRKEGEPYSALALSAQPSVWILTRDIPKLKEASDTIILNSNTAMTDERRMESLRKSAMNVVEDLFEDPTPQNIDKSVKVVGSFVYVLMKDPKAYMHLAKLSSHDPYTLQHSVGTAVHCIILARKLGITDEKDLLEVGLAGLLHDIGKVKVKKEIINKNGPLDELEWEEMRAHALEGYEIVKNNPKLTERTKRAILEHHEDKNGTGYPLALRYDEVDLFSKIVCICDVFNALTTNRSYSKARAPFEAFQLMREKLTHKIDDECFRQLVLIYGGQLAGNGSAEAEAG